MLWRIVNFLAAFVSLLLVLPITVNLILHGTVQSLTLVPFIVVESMQVVFLLIAPAPIHGCRSSKELLVACSCALLPVLSSGYFGSHLPPHRIASLIDIGIILTVIAQILIVWALWNLRTSFSILPETRVLRSAGIYRYVRHPIYANYFLWYLGSSLIIQNSIYAMAMVGVTLLQAWRAHFEDRKLAELGEKALQYQRRTGMFFPKWAKSHKEPV